MVKLKDVEEKKGFSTKPVGWYQVQIQKVESKTSSKGTPYFNFWMKIVEGEYKGQFIFCPIYLTAKSVGFLKPFLKAIEFSDEYEIIIEDEVVVIPQVEFEKQQQLMVLLDHQKDKENNPKEKVVSYKSLAEEGRVRIEVEDDEEIPF